MAYLIIKFNLWAKIKFNHNTFLRFHTIDSPRLSFTTSSKCCYSKLNSTNQGWFRYCSQHTSLFTKLSKKASKTQRRRGKLKKYAELIQVGDKSGSSAKEILAKIKHSSPTKVLKKLGITSSDTKLSERTSTEKQKEKKASTFEMNVSSGKDSADTVKDTCTVSSLRLDLKNSNNVQEQHDFHCHENLNDSFYNKLNDYSLASDFSANSTQRDFHEELDVNSSIGIIDYSSLRNRDVLLPNDLEPEIEEDVLDNIDIENFDSKNLKLSQDIEKLTTTIQVKGQKDNTKNKEKKVKKKHKSYDQEKLLNVYLKQIENGKMNREYMNLISYLDVCVNNDMVCHAHCMLLNYVKKLDLASNDKSTDLFNIVLHGLAKDGKWEMLKQLLMFMKEEGYKPNLQSYSAAIECLVRRKENNEIKHVLQTIKKSGLCLENILEDCTFINDQKEIILQGIFSIYPNFQPKKHERSKLYNCELLHSLNSEMPENRYYTPCGNIISKQKLKELADLQIDMESKSKIVVKSIAKDELLAKKNFLPMQKILSDCQNIWRNALMKNFAERVQMLKKAQSSERMNLYPYMVALNSEDYVNFMMQEIEAIGQLSEGFSSMLSVMQINLGKKIMDRYHLQKKKKNGIFKKIKSLYEKYCDYYSDPNLTSQYIPRHYWAMLQTTNSNGPNTDFYTEKLWPRSVLLKIGQFLYEILMKNVIIDINLFHPGKKSKNLSPAFFTIYRKHNIVKIREEIKPHPVLAKLYRLANNNLTFAADSVPMISPPLPWTTIHSGGFLLASTSLIRWPFSYKFHHNFDLEKVNSQNLYPTFDALNQLAECPWKINEPILDLVIHIFNNKGNMELDIPQPVSECEPLPKFKGISREKAKQIWHDRAVVKQKRQEMYSLWCDMLYKLSIANKFRKHIIWFPYNIDFRGRVYPCPPHFNHLGSDVSRGLLLFAQGEEIGEKGLKWLKIHLINLTGLRKRSSLQERLEYCDEIIDDIMDSADNPLTGRKWWMKSDEPWQTLACCMELTKCLRSPNPEKYICHFPVHQDGSCNGLQHYAALGRDIEGAEQVNLTPKDTPQDVYTTVAEMVETDRAKDAANNVNMAQILEGFISRKVVKQPVMTTVYGVTYFGAIHQIIRRLKEIPDFPEEHYQKAASYLATKIFFSLQSMFSATKQIQDWLTRSARFISSECMQPVQWNTPLGLPVLQPYFRNKKICHDKKTKDTRPIILELPNTRKQKNAFPPNYIHSLDSCHMMLTALFCQRVGITYVSVHDCFWVHPNNVDIMNKICREQFVALHSLPLLERLSKDMEKLNETYGVNEKKQDFEILKSVPKRGHLDIKDVLTSTYFFS